MSATHTNNLGNAIETTIVQLSELYTSTQAKIREFAQEIDALEALPVSPDEAEAQLRQVLDGYISRDDPDHRPELVKRLERFSKVVAHGRPLNEHTTLATHCFSTIAERSGPVSPGFILADFLPVLLVLFPERVDQILVPMVRDYAERNGGIDSATRGKKLTKLRTEKRELELQEEAIISEAEVNGIWTLARRPNCDPAIVLALAEVDEAA